jgi:hypothetical protein
LVNLQIRERLKFGAITKMAAVGACILLLVAVVMFISLPDVIKTTNPAVGLTVTIVAGVAALLSIIVLTVFVLGCLGLTNENEALGLPTGSVRAIIALSLILIFAILTFYMFQYMNDPLETTTTTIYTNSTIGNQTITNSTTTTIQGTGQAMVDFSKQTLTTVGTLVVAIAAFYFGTRSVQVAQGSKETADLFVDPSGKNDWIIGDEPIIIIVKPIPEDVAYIWRISGDEYTSISTLSPNKLKYTPTAKEPKEVTLTFRLPQYSDVDPIVLTVNIVKPGLSIEPSEEKEVVNGKDLLFEVKPAPKDAKVECEISDDKRGSVTVTKEDPNKFKFEPKVDEGEVTLTFKLTKYPAVSKELKVNIVKPDLSIEPSKAPEVVKGKDITFEAKPTPKDAKVECTVSGDNGKSVKTTKENPNKFTYTPTVENQDVTLTFKLPQYPDLAPKELKFKVKPK